LDSHQHHQRARWSGPAHRGLDRQRNDRLGWREPHRKLQHRRQILRASWTNPYANTDSYCYTDGNGNAYIHTKAYAHAETAPNAAATPVGDSCYLEACDVNSK
jgi:hypothetical protein